MELVNKSVLLLSLNCFLHVALYAYQIWSLTPLLQAENTDLGGGVMGQKFLVTLYPWRDGETRTVDNFVMMSRTFELSYVILLGRLYQKACDLCETHNTLGEMRNAFTISVWKLQEKRPRGRCSSRYADNIKLDLGEMEV